MEQKKGNMLPKREEIDQAYKWKLEDMFANQAEWEADFNQIKQLYLDIAKYKGQLKEGADKLAACLKERDLMFSMMDKVFVYARMKRDENNANSQYQALTDRAMLLSTEVYAAESFIVPELISIPEDILYGFLKQNTALEIYRHFIDEIIRQKKHILSEKEEELLALASEVAHAPHDIFTMFNNADIKFPTIKDEMGNDVEVTKGRYIKLLESKDQRVRRDAFKALYSTYNKSINTLATTLSSNVKKNRFFTNVRKYNSCLEASLDSDNVPVTVYDTLIETVGNHLHLLHRYLRLRKKALKLDELHMYDLFVPIIEEPKTNISYKDALQMVEESIYPLGETYGKDLEEAFSSGWIDVFENEGKTSGAYSWGAYSAHPYVLLNYQGTFNDVFTIAHEMGHALHSYYTNMHQPYINSEYKIFVAEVASTLNESLLVKHLLKKCTDPKEKIYLLNHYLEEFRGTLFRQVMFAEFEKIIHAKAEQGVALTTQEINEIYLGLNQKYFGSEVVMDEEIAIEWARIPHFYSSFYVYKYATGISAAASLSKQILNDGPEAQTRYLNFLSSGGSDYPLELLKKAGVDLTEAKPIEDALHIFEEILNELEGLL